MVLLKAKFNSEEMNPLGARKRRQGALKNQDAKKGREEGRLFD